MINQRLECYNDVSHLNLATWSMQSLTAAVKVVINSPEWSWFTSLMLYISVSVYRYSRGQTISAKVTLIPSWPIRISQLDLITCTKPRVVQANSFKRCYVLAFMTIDHSLGSWREFGCCDDANAWRKSTKEADKHIFFYCNLESKNLSMHWRHHRTNSHQSSSES